MRPARFLSDKINYNLIICKRHDGQPQGLTLRYYSNFNVGAGLVPARIDLTPYYFINKMDIHDYQQNGNVRLHFWHQARLGLIKYLTKNLKHNSTIASIGCGTGEELTILTEQGQVIGYDINQTVLALAEQQGFKTIYFDIAKNQLPTKYDIITAFDVLEHIKDDQSALKNISQSLKTDGYFLLTVPAYQWLMSSHDLALNHYRRYNKKELANKLARAGLVIKKIGYWNCCLAPLIIAVRLFKKLYPPVKHLSEAKTPPLFFNHLGLLILFLENFLIKIGLKLPWGISLYVVAVKAEK